MRQRILAYIFAANLILSMLAGTTVALFADSETASMSLTAGRVEMRLSEISGDGLQPVMNVIVVNEGTVNADLWLENIYRRQNDAAESELNDLSEINAGGDAEDVTVEVIYKSEITSFILNDLDRHDAPLLLLEGMEPGSDAQVTIRQNADLQPNVIQGSLAEDSPPDAYYEQLSVPVPYIFEFILKSGTFTSLTGESVFTLTKFFEAYHQSAESNEPATELEETPETQAAGETAAHDPVDSSSPPGEVKRENSTEPATVTAAPEPPVEAAPQPEEPEETMALPSKPDLSEFQE